MAKAFPVLLCAIWARGINAHVSFLNSRPERIRLKSELGWSGTTHFLDDTGVMCAEGNAEDVEGALALKKAGPRGALYEQAAAKPGPCNAQGFTYLVGAGADGCYPGITRSFKNANDATQFQGRETNALNNYAEQWGLSTHKASLLHDCTCHQQSSLKNAAFMECASGLNGMNGSWVHRNPVDDSTLMCDGGPFFYATMALAVLKSTAQLPMHLHDQIAPVNCDQQGFPYIYPVIDHCFVGMHMWMKTPNIGTDPGIQMSASVESGLFGGGFSSYATDNGLNGQVLNRISGCHCSPHSSVGSSNPLCSMGHTTSPIRSWLVE